MAILTDRAFQDFSGQILLGDIFHFVEMTGGAETGFSKLRRVHGSMDEILLRIRIGTIERSSWL